MSARRIHIDTDPGLDDLLALAFAFGSPELSVEGVTTVAGNAPLEVVTENARRFLALAGADTPLGAGEAGPLALGRIDATHFHGADGRLGVSLPEARARPTETAAAVLRRSIAERGVECLVALGPLSNVAVLAHESPELLARVEVVWMGATLGRGNVTAQAEFNAYADPRALRVVLEHGARLRVIGLDVTTRVAVREEELADAPRGGARAAVIDAALRSLCQVERKYFGRGLAILHDPCAIAAAFAPGLFSFRKLALEVTEREGPERGRVRAAGPGAVDYAVEVRADELAAEFLARVSAWAER